MIGLVRATVICATLALGLTAAGAADKAFKRDELADSAVKLEAQIKSEAGPVAKSSATLRNDADAAFRRSDFRVGLQILGQIAATTPEDSANWLKLAKTIFQIRSASSSEQTFLYERASTAAYIAYQRAGNPAEEADALAVLGRAMSERKLWRPALDALRLSLDMREVAEVRGQYEKMRDEHGFRLLDYTVDSDGASPRACFQFSEDLAKRVDFAPFVALAGTDKPALTSEGKQLCVDGLKHGERYNINLRAGLPSTVKEMPAEIGRVQHLCARPQAVRALHRPRLCAAAHRPARHSAGQRQHAVGERQRVPDRRPQSDQHGGRQRFPEDALQLPALGSRRRARRQGLDRRTRDRDHAEPGRRDGVPGRPGARRSAARRLCDDGVGQGPRQRRR